MTSKHEATRDHPAAAPTTLGTREWTYRARAFRPEQSWGKLDDYQPRHVERRVAERRTPPPPIDIETVADVARRALWKNDPGLDHWDDVSEKRRDHWRNIARAALTAAGVQA